MSIYVEREVYLYVLPAAFAPGTAWRKRRQVPPRSYQAPRVEKYSYHGYGNLMRRQGLVR